MQDIWELWDDETTHSYFGVFFGFWFGSRRTKKWDYEIKNEDEKDENKTIYPV